LAVILIPGKRAAAVMNSFLGVNYYFGVFDL